MTVFQIDQAKEISPRAYLVCVATGRESHPDAPEELTELVRSDGLDPVGMMLAKRDKPDPATYLGYYICFCTLNIIKLYCCVIYYFYILWCWKCWIEYIITNIFHFLCCKW